MGATLSYVCGASDEPLLYKTVGTALELIIRGGENTSPREIEEFLYRHPKVQEAQVFGIPDARYGEVVCAWPEEYCDAEAMRRFCAEQIAHYKVPQHIRFVSEFPMTVIGKIQKFVMRERMIEEINLNIERGPA
jgi:fatty-acyl-CoA synthase